MTPSMIQARSFGAWKLANKGLNVEKGSGGYDICRALGSLKCRMNRMEMPPKYQYYRAEVATTPARLNISQALLAWVSEVV